MTKDAGEAPALQQATPARYPAPSSARQTPLSKTPAGPLDLDSYAAELRRCADQISALRVQPSEIPRFRQGLPAYWEVRAGSGKFEVSTAWLGAALGEIETHPGQAPGLWQQIVARLDFQREQAEALAARSEGPPLAAARAQLNAIFRGAEFRGLAGPTPWQLWWQRIETWIGTRIERLLERLHLGAETSGYVAYGLIAVALVLLSVALWRSLGRRAREWGEEAPQPAPAADWRSWVREAFDAAERGEYRAAIHAAYWGAVARLENSGVIPGDRSRTPREIVRELDSQADLRGPFRDLASRFELAWYGYRPPQAADWQETKSQLERMGCLGVSTAETSNS